MRPNYAQDAPPTAIAVGGVAYRCEVDYRVWIEVLRLMREMDAAAGEGERMQDSLRRIDAIQTLVFGGVLVDEDPVEVLRAVAEFSKGYPGIPVKDAGDAPLFSFEWDMQSM